MKLTVEEIKSRIAAGNWFKNPDLDNWMLGQKLGLSEEELSEFFKQETGMVLKEFLIEFRIDLVIALLDKTIIFERPGFYFRYSGFKSRTPFEKHFKAKTGMALQQYILESKEKLKVV